MWFEWLKSTEPTSSSRVPYVNRSREWKGLLCLGNLR
jgi:hypothetical protein